MSNNPPAVKPVPLADTMFNGQTRQLMRFAVEGSTDWCAFNPSICTTEKYGTLVLFRSANGYLKDHRPEFQMPLGAELESGDNYRYPSEFNALSELTTIWDGVPRFHNRLFIARMLKHPNTRLTELCEVDLTEAYAQAPVPMLRGVEDARLFWDGESMCILATAYETRAIPVARICKIRLDVSNVRKVRGISFELYDSPNGADRVEKNWMPVHQEGMKKPPKFDYIYESGFTYSTKTNSLTDVGGYHLPLRGGSQLIPLSDGTYLAVAHQVPLADLMRFSDIKRSPLMRRRYLHRFVQYTDSGQVFKVTNPFNFLNKSIEFAAGMTIRGDKVLVTFGALDSSAHLSVLELDEVMAALRRPLTAT
jgi:predicted GH43/DUF377 family glycosyl hydrolase